MLATATVKNIRCRTIVGAYDWERNVTQDIIINFSVEYDATNVINSDNLDDTLNYCELAEEIVEKVEKTEFFILEKLVSFILDIIMSRPNAIQATVEVDKVAPLRRFADSVSIKGSRKRK